MEDPFLSLELSCDSNSHLFSVVYPVMTLSLQHHSYCEKLSSAARRREQSDGRLPEQHLVYNTSPWGGLPAQSRPNVSA